MTTMDEVKLQQVERDICLLYHQLADYCYIMEDLDYATLYTLPYWEFLNIPNVEPERRAFVREGCLVLLLAMAGELIAGTGSYLTPYLQLCQTAVNALIPEDERAAKLIDAVKMALREAVNQRPESEELGTRSQWVHREFVMGYYRKKVKEFDTNPYFDMDNGAL